MNDTAQRPEPGAAAAVVARLRRELGAERVIHEAEGLRPYECDALTIYRDLPLAVALPRDAAQVRSVLRVCHELDLPVVARGAGTGLCAGSMPHPEGVLLNLAGLDRVLEVDPLARSARVQPGVSNLAISAAAAPHGLYYAPDPSSQVACSIGGNVASNSGGVHCLKYGLTVHNVLGVTLLTVEGEEVRLGGAALDSPGCDLMALVTGSEGLLGVVTEVSVRLLPSPPCAQVLLAGFDSVRAAGEAVGAIIAAGIVPAGLEMMDSLAIQAAEDYCAAGYPRDAAAILLCEVDGTAQEVEQHGAQLAALLREQGASSLRVSGDEQERQLLWRGRKSAFPAVGRLAPDYYCMDGTIPRGRVADVLEDIARLSAEFGLRVANVFHAGDGNLHPLILFDAGDPQQVQRAEAFGARILELSVRVGGCITGEHGVGVEKLRSMPGQFGERELRQFEEIKAAFDPRLNLNPGKGIPILKRCQEYRALPARHRHEQPGAAPVAPPPRAVEDAVAELAARVAAAHDEGRCLYIRAGDSKRDLLGRRCDAAPLDVSAHRGVIDYAPGEMVITVRAATPVQEVIDVLAAEGQGLACDPPRSAGRATIGGSLACNLSGPARPWSGSLRDAVLGLGLINGRGEVLRFGGRVMKNVAGYDVSRLQAGAMGTLGVITDLSLKVMPLAQQRLTLAYEMDAAQALATMQRRACEPAPLDGACWFDGRLLLRLSGADSAVQAARRAWGGEALENNDDRWARLRDLTLPQLCGEGPLWRLGVGATAALEHAPAVIDWGGAQRWFPGEREAAAMHDSARRGGGHACLLRGGDRAGEVLSAPAAGVRRLQRALKRAFDPRGVLNPGRLYGWLED
ncbi:MAG: glycolate oxidase subunit GlcE [Halioglobus sp.]|nr:glycolate oxidase subunit GlcE [Halioglobus sp.]